MSTPWRAPFSWANGPLDRSLKDVRLKLHQQIVGAGPAVHLQGMKGNAGIRPHGVQHVADLIGDGLQGGADAG